MNKLFRNQSVSQIIEDLRQGIQYSYENEKSRELFFKYDARIQFFIVWTLETIHPEDSSYYDEKEFAQFLKNLGFPI